MFEIDGDAATVKLDEAVHVMVNAGGSSVIAHFRELLCDMTSQGDWVLTGIYRDGNIYTFERVNACKDWPISKTKKRSRE